MERLTIAVDELVRERVIARRLPEPVGPFDFSLMISPYHGKQTGGRGRPLF
jgi:hypothetical protein